jgi:hypothetical protein
MLNFFFNDGSLDGDESVDSRLTIL